MSPRLHAIREACKVPPEQRTDENIDAILEFVKDVAFLAELNDFQQRGICKNMTLEAFSSKENIVEMGEVGSKFYIILSGAAVVQVPDRKAPCPKGVHTPDTCDCPNRPVDRLASLPKGTGFGEIALLKDEPRSATIQTIERTEVLVTKRADYDRFAGQHHKHFTQQRVKFLRRCPCIEEALMSQSVSSRDIAAMANCLTDMHLTGNALACRQGEMADRMIFVRSGQLVMLRAVDVDDPKRGQADAEQSAAKGSSGSQDDPEGRRRDRAARLLKLESDEGAASEDSKREPMSSRGASKDQVHAEKERIASKDQDAQLQAARPAARGSTIASHRAKDGQQPGRHKESRIAADGAAPSLPSPPRRKRLLRIGTLGPDQYYGDQQLCNNEVYPVSLVSDPIAEIYVMSKQDILRQLPKKKASSLFNREKVTEIVPSDEQLLQMHRLNERWNAFRRSMHAEALGNRTHAPSHGLREPTSASRINAADNLEFLGITSPGSIAKAALPLPSNKGSSLTFREQAHFSNASAKFLRQVEDVKSDEGLRAALAKDGLIRQHGLGDFLSAEDGGADDPMTFWLKKCWSHLGSDPVGIDIDLALKSTDVDPSVPSNRGGDSSTPRSTRRTSLQPAASAGEAAELRLPPLAGAAGKSAE